MNYCDWCGRSVAECERDGWVMICSKDGFNWICEVCTMSAWHDIVTWHYNRRTFPRIAVEGDIALAEKEP